MEADKKRRHAKILNIITGNVVSNQKELLGLLESSGVRTTQATISRDIRDLGLVKASVDGGGYRYMPRGGQQVSNVPTSIFNEVMSINHSGQIIVIRTHPGFAQSVAVSVDSLGWPEFLGSVGGDDTVMIIVAADKNIKEALKKLKRFFEQAGQGILK